MDRIEVLGEFGVLNRQALERIWPKDRKLVRHLDTGLSRSPTGDHDSPVIAFWLPCNLGQKINVEVIYKVFDKGVFVPLEDLFFRFFGLKNDSSLPNEMLFAPFLQK